MTNALIAPAGKVLVHRYKPRGNACTAFGRRDAEILLSGPAGTGKSRAALEKLNGAAVKHKGMRGLIVRKTRESLTSTALRTFREHVITEQLAAGTTWWYGGSTEEPPQYRYDNGSAIMVGGMDKSIKIMSSEYDMAYAQEATELTTDDWEKITTRLRNGVMPYQQLLADCNPDRPDHWLNQRSLEGHTLQLPTRHQDNPRYYDEILQPDGTVGYVLTQAGHDYIVGKLGALTGVRRLRLLDGIWASAEGLVYEDWDDNVHPIDSMPPGWENWPRYWSIDFGYSNPFVCQMWAMDGDGRLYLYREIYMSHRLVEDHCETIKKIVIRPDGSWREPQPEAIVCDHDAEGRATFERHMGISTVAARKAPSAGQKGLVGLQETQARYKIQPDGKPRIFFLRGCTVELDEALRDAGLPTSTVGEVTGYVWPPDVKPDQREHPVKKDDHGMDGKRYVVGHVDLGAEFNIRFW